MLSKDFINGVNFIFSVFYYYSNKTVLNVTIFFKNIF
jgi:hypothetical protein